MIQLGIYRHYKGQLYQVIALARHSETLEELVVYQTLYGDFGMWVRPAALFFGKLEYNGKQVDRFTWVSQPMTTAPAAR